jgi:hypothetical protein
MTLFTVLQPHDGTHICASTSQYSLHLRYCVVDYFLISWDVSPGPRSSDISESIIAALSCLPLTGTFLPLVNEVVKVSGLRGTDRSNNTWAVPESEALESRL